MGLIFSHIVCMSQNGVIGNGGSMPWHIPEDLRRFKQTTLGHPLIMGRKTWQSLPGKLPHREHIVVTRQPHLMRDVDAFVCASLEEAYDTAQDLCAKKDASRREAFVIGGGEIYRQSFARIKRIYQTVIQKDYQGDVTYPSFSSVSRHIGRGKGDVFLKIAEEKFCARDMLGRLKQGGSGPERWEQDGARDRCENAPEGVPLSCLWLVHERPS